MTLTKDQISNITDTPSDTISLEGNEFSGKVYYYVLETQKLVLQTLDISTSKDEELPGFIYRKPTGDALSPKETYETEKRYGYYPLAIIENGYRGPNHLHRKDNALFCAVENDEGVWETRYFPEQNISIRTWEKANDIIANNNKD